MKQNKKILIIGAGPAGLSAARVLSENGYSVEIFELDSQVGGMSKSIELFSQIVDIGPHRFFSKDKRLNDFWHSHTNGEYEKVSRLTRIFYNRKFFYYPLRGFDALFKLGFLESTLCVLSYIRAKISPFKGDSFESWVANAFGYRLYSIFFKSYTEKLWGIKCSELDADFAAQRIKGLNLYEAIKSAFFGGGGKKHKTLVDEFSYPKKGCGVVYENMKQEIIKRGGVVHCGVEVLGITTQGKKAVGIHTNKGEFSGDIVISTAPFRDMVLSLDELDCGVKELAGRLKFRNTILVYVEVKNSALGNHSADFGDFEATADLKSSSAPKSPKNYESNTAIPRILEEEKQAWHKNADTLESTFDTAPILSEQAKDSRICDEKSGLFKDSQGCALGVHNRPEQPEIADLSRKAESTQNAQNVFCSHPDNNAYNDRNNVRIVDEKCGLQEKSQGSYLSGNDRRDFLQLPHLSQQAALFKDNWIYVHSKDTQTGRITNFANWTKDLQCGQDSAILCLEYWANDDEPLWNLDDNALSEIAKRDLLESKLVADSSLIKNTSVLKIHKSYPVYERGYKDNLHKIYKALDSFKDLYFIGRNGSFKYNNQDHSILMGLMCADKILGRECDLWHINTDYDYQESGKA
ncbi:FAD-dependent oxidoreductase [Helicobacter zhangjianzhongii]|uniref:FAD-dependent oxidoreductase n=1 Tax=Helicobacter zhangjianzhongii TaxID=2974574 RepID=UPI002555D697|nr:FAD-dependent oxidoreductase [Helicobacter sp. CPD2-1]MDL0079102.1 FAD-dependent oxidoreductase [Helicobacter sp. CPD2-1]